MKQLARWLHLGELESDLPNPRRARHETSAYRRPLGACATPAASPAPAPFPFPRPQAPGLPADPYGHLVRPQDRHRLGRPARRVGLRLWQDLPPLPAALASSRGLAAT